MLKKPALLVWLDRNIKTKEDFQLLMVAILIVFIVCTKCYLVISSNTGMMAGIQNHTQGLNPHIRPELSLTK